MRHLIMSVNTNASNFYFKKQRGFVQLSFKIPVSKRSKNDTVSLTSINGLK